MIVVASVLGSLVFWFILAHALLIGGPAAYGLAVVAAAINALIVGGLLRRGRAALLVALGALPLAIVVVAVAHVEPVGLRAVLTGVPGIWFGYCLLLALKSGDYGRAPHR